MRGTNPLDESSVLAKSWKKLKRLHPIAIDLERLDLVNRATKQELRDPDALASLIVGLGLNDDGLEELPSHLHDACGQGLRIWQYPIQFGPYLAMLTEQAVTSYLELGTRHGGTFAATVEVLERFAPITRAVGIDIMPCPGLVELAKRRPGVSFHRFNTQSADFASWIESQARFDLALIDANHDEHECRREVELVRGKARIIVLHDITSIDFPGVGSVWNELVASGDYDTHTFVDQYDGLGPYMGIGVAILKDD